VAYPASFRRRERGLREPRGPSSPHLSGAAQHRVILQWRTTAPVTPQQGDDPPRGACTVPGGLVSQAHREGNDDGSLEHIGRVGEARKSFVARFRPPLPHRWWRRGHCGHPRVERRGSTADLPAARAEVRAVHLTGFAVPPVQAWGALLERLSGNQARTAVLVSPAGGAADVTTAVMTTRTAGLTKSRESDPAPTLKKVDAVALAATPAPPWGRYWDR
jgi:hypothetical protein